MAGTSGGGSVELSTLGLRERTRQSHSQVDLESPSYGESQYETIIRRQRIRSNPNALKIPHRDLTKIISNDDNENDFSPPASLFPEVLHEFDFAGWGSFSYLEVSAEDITSSTEVESRATRSRGDGVLNTWTATGVAGAAVAGSPFYVFPALVGVAGIYSPISLLIGTLGLSCWIPIMGELASAFPQSGANYIYLLNTTVKPLAIFAPA